MILKYKLDIPQEHEALIKLIFSKRDILSILDQVHRVLPGSKELVELVIELRDMEGVAHTTGSNFKQHISLSSSYFIKVDSQELELEIHGVLCHELVHTIQYNGFGTADGGLIEGIADYVRLVIFGPAVHWRREKGGNWNSGYSITAYFLKWIQDEIKPDFIARLNLSLKEKKWTPAIFRDITGQTVDYLWTKYQDTF